MDVEKIALYAEEMLRVADDGSLVAPISGRWPGFGVEEAYEVSLAVLRRREEQGWRRVGRKIGFTNYAILEQFGVEAPIFGYMYDRSVSYASEVDGKLTGEVSLAGLPQPFIEPEIVFCLRETPPGTDDPVALLRSIDWLAHGFEVVRCHFPDWQFEGADTIADGGLHGRYVVGEKRPGSDAESLAQELESFKVQLFRNGELAAEGGGANVLSSPLNALAYLTKVLRGLPEHPPLQAGELVTTGTLTAALTPTPGDVWSTRFEGLDVAPLELRFKD